MTQLGDDTAWALPEGRGQSRAAGTEQGWVPAGGQWDGVGARRPLHSRVQGKGRLNVPRQSNPTSRMLLPSWPIAADH